MRRATEASSTPPCVTRPLALITVTLLIGTLASCERAPTGADRFDALQPPGPQTSAASALNSAAPFKNWHQGFNHGTTAWYGGDTPGPLGWCGQITQVEKGGGSLQPSAGQAYATVEQGVCNDFWDGIFSAPGATLVNGPWAPGPDFGLFSSVWPTGGFVMELDIYLDPSWTVGALEPGTVNFFAPPGAVFTYAASLRELGSPADAFGTFYYFAVPVMPNDGKLTVLGHDVTEAGWYTFRHVFSDDGGELAVDFELAERSGGTLFTEPITTEFFSGAPTSNLIPTDLGSGYIWFASIAPGLELPIDEHRLRRGR
jgi:hypothetical protein